MRSARANKDSKHIIRTLVASIFCAVTIVGKATAFEGRIEAGTTKGGETTPLLYTVGTDSLRVEVTGTSSPNPIDILDLKTGTLTLVFPHNRGFLRLDKAAQNASAGPAGAAGMPLPSGGLPSGISPQASGNVLQTATLPAGMPVMPPLPAMADKLELKATGKKEKILSYACEQYELKRRGETLEIWATDQLFAYQPYVRNQPHRFGPRMLEEEWPQMLRSRKLFPLRVSLRFDNGPERFHFEVEAIKPDKIDDKDGKLFQPPAGYTEMRPLPL